MLNSNQNEIKMGVPLLVHRTFFFLQKGLNIGPKVPGYKHARIEINNNMNTILNKEHTLDVIEYIAIPHIHYGVVEGWVYT